jgi:hypothetical protein
MALMVTRGVETNSGTQMEKIKKIDCTDYRQSKESDDTPAEDWRF